MSMCILFTITMLYEFVTQKVYLQQPLFLLLLLLF